MLITCALVIAMLCVPWQEARIDLSPQRWPEAYAAITAADGVVTMLHESEHTFIGPWAGSARHCERRLCIDYWRQDDGALTRLFVRRPDCDVARALVVKGKSPAARDRLLAGLLLIPAGGVAQDAVPLSQLDDRRPMPGGSAAQTDDRPSPDLSCSD